MRFKPLTTATGVAVSILAATWLRRSRQIGLNGKNVFITGGSRGLGLVLAKEFAVRGAKIAISARAGDELQRAKVQLQTLTGSVLAIESDITLREEAENAVAQINDRLGPVDILVNNAGTITVGPLETMTIDDFRDSLNTHFWGPYFVSMAVLPTMRRRKAGSIINISSIGGKISVPHLVPYSVGKFALTGFSEGLRSELLKDNIYVTTVCPGLMRTGSPQNALFKGKNEAEYAWFSISDALPIVSMSARRAAKSIVHACIHRKAEVVLSLPAKFASLLHGVAPGTTADILGVVNRILPSAGGKGVVAKTGQQSSSNISPSWMTTLNEQAAQQNNQIP
ncbi:MAG TPA: SDR family NAD(P)-dependent oxidoreductase [Terriglobales bacterium]|nr:SDR family NAD(P)-dependent oxidoreductase [Terriglobales bacterium]